MKRTREEKRAALETKAKELIDELMKWSEETEEPDMTQIEDEILKLRQRLSESMLETVMDRQETQRPVPGPVCPKCRKEMQYKGDKLKRVTSRVGEVKLERGHYYCSHCKESLFPPGSATEDRRKALE
jgi:SNF2 family DNA or RNA helicase